MPKTRWIIWLTCLLNLHLCFAEQVKVQTVDESGATASNILVIVNPLDTSAISQGRFLTDSKGQTPVFELVPGLYQFVATYPYGMWRDSVVERYIDRSTKEIVLRVSVKTLMDVISLSGRRVSVHVSGLPDKSSLVGIRVLIRGTDGSSSRWAKTGATGRLGVDLVDGPTILVVPIDGRVYTFVLLDDCGTNDPLGRLPRSATCVSIKNSFAEIEIPKPILTSPE